MNILPGADRAPIRTGVNVAYSDEFRDQQTNSALLQSLASMAPKGSKPGRVIEDPDGQGRIEALVEAVNPFRRDLPKATASQDIWFLLVLFASCVFFFDVFIRRVHVSFAWVTPMAVQVRNTVLRRERAPVQTETMDRLRSRKAEIDEHIERRRSAARFEPEDETPAGADALEEATAGKPPPKRSEPNLESLTPEQEEESYTARLLKAKKKVWEDRKKSGQ